MHSLPPHTILFLCGENDGRFGKNLPDVIRCYENITIRYRVESSAHGLNIIEDDRFALFLLGHLYFTGSSSIEPEPNLRYLLEALHRCSSFEEAMIELAGGLFSLFVVDRSKQTLQVSLDRLGCAPVYYREDDSEVKVSNNQFLFQRNGNLSEAAVGEFIKYGYLPFSESLFKSVRRVSPGEVLNISLAPSSAVMPPHRRRHRKYLPLPQRSQRVEETAILLSDTLDRYFARLPNGPYLAGLSGGYDSRLIAAYLKTGELRLINFGNPASREVRLAKRIARDFKKDIESFSVPETALHLYGDHLKSFFGPSAVSLEDIHVFELIKRVREQQPIYYADGFIGDTVIGSGYYYKLVGGSESLSSNLLLRSQYESPIQDRNVYVRFLYHNERAIPDHDLLGVISDEIRDEIELHAMSLVNAHLEWSYTHEDMVEGLTHAMRGSRLIATGPLSIGRIALCACPFIDHQVFDLCMDSAKRLRAGDSLYNALWRYRFPDYSRIQKSNTGGCASDSDRGYRLKHLASAIARRSLYPTLKRFTGGLIDKTEEYKRIDGYFSQDENLEYLRSAADRSAGFIPNRIANTCMERFYGGNLPPLFMLRLGSLFVYLDRGSQDQA